MPKWATGVPSVQGTMVTDTTPVGADRLFSGALARVGVPTHVVATHASGECAPGVVMAAREFAVGADRRPVPSREKE